MERREKAEFCRGCGSGAARQGSEVSPARTGVAWAHAWPCILMQELWPPRPTSEDNEQKQPLRPDGGLEPQLISKDATVFRVKKHPVVNLIGNPVSEHSEYSKITFQKSLFPCFFSSFSLWWWGPELNSGFLGRFAFY